MKKTLIFWLLAALYFPNPAHAQEKAPIIGLSATYETSQNCVPNTYIIFSPESRYPCDTSGDRRSGHHSAYGGIH